MIAPKQFLYSEFNYDGKIQNQATYHATTKRNPQMVRRADGRIGVLGGVAYDPHAPPPERTLPSLGEIPIPLPSSGPTPDPAKKNRPRTLLDR